MILAFKDRANFGDLSTIQVVSVGYHNGTESVVFRAPNANLPRLRDGTKPTMVMQSGLFTEAYCSQEFKTFMAAQLQDKNSEGYTASQAEQNFLLEKISGSNKEWLGADIRERKPAQPSSTSS